MLALLLIAAQLRTSWYDLPIAADWGWFVESSNALATGHPPTTGQFLYTSVPCVLFAGLIELFQDPIRLMQSWAVLGALVAPITYLAVRRLAGPLGGLAAGWIVATDLSSAVTVMGIKSPYAIASWTALACLGLVGATQRRTWGVPVLVLGTALAVSHHLGLWLLAPAVTVLAGVHLLRLPRPRALAAGGIALLLGGAVLAIVIGFDLHRLMGEVVEYRARFDRPEASFDVGLITFVKLLVGRLPATHAEELLSGMASNIGTLELLGACTVLGFGGATARAAWQWRTRRRDPALSATHRPALEASVVGLQAFLLLGLGISPYLANLVGNDYFETHHVVALPPLALVALAGWARGVAPVRLGAWGRLVPTAAVGAWLWMVMPQLMEVPSKGGGPTLLPTDSFMNTAAVANAVREDARVLGRQPFLLQWSQRPHQYSPWMLADLAEDLARLNRDEHELPKACYLLTPTRLARRISTGREVALPTETGLALWAYDDCDQLAALEEVLCHGQGHSYLWTGEHHGPREVARTPDWPLSCVLAP